MCGFFLNVSFLFHIFVSFVTRWSRFQAVSVGIFNELMNFWALFESSVSDAVMLKLLITVHVLLLGDDNAELGDQSFQYITTDNMKSARDDSLIRSTVRAFHRRIMDFFQLSGVPEPGYSWTVKLQQSLNNCKNFKSPQ